MTMSRQIERRPKPLDDVHYSGTAIGNSSALLQGSIESEDCTQEGATDYLAQLRVGGEQEAQALGAGEAPLSYRSFRDHAVHELRRSLGHTTATAGWAEASDAVSASPADWMPWNYTATLARINGQAVDAD